MWLIKTLFSLIILFSGIWFFISCERPEDTSYVDPEQLNQTEYTFIPEQPTSREEIQLIFRGCTYYQTVNMQTSGNNITVKKRFNSQLKWPCVVDYDTIPLGKLKKGEYSITLQIIDVNPFISDSVFFSEIKTLEVTNK